MRDVFSAALFQNGYLPALLILVCAAALTCALPVQAASTGVAVTGCPPVSDSALEERSECEPSHSPRRENAATIEQMLLPDLQTLPIFDLKLMVNYRTGEKTIRFGNAVVNSGLGVLELTGEIDWSNQRLLVTQHLYGPDEEELIFQTGSFVFHPEHEHWHWDTFSTYEVWSVEPDGSLEARVSESEKAGYCMMDIRRIEPEWLEANNSAHLDVSSRRSYFQCHWRRQGISPGWVDTYPSYLPGQSIDITSLPDGVYALRSEVNPDGILYERDRSNNITLLYFSLTKDKLEILDDDSFLDNRAALTEE